MKKMIVEDAHDDFREHISVSLFWMVLSLLVMLFLHHWPKEEQGPFLNRVNTEYKVTLCSWLYGPKGVCFFRPFCVSGPMRTPDPPEP